MAAYRPLLYFSPRSATLPLGEEARLSYFPESEFRPRIEFEKTIQRQAIWTLPHGPVWFRSHTTAAWTLTAAFACPVTTGVARMLWQIETLEHGGNANALGWSNVGEFSVNASAVAANRIQYVQTQYNGSVPLNCSVRIRLTRLTNNVLDTLDADIYLVTGALLSFEDILDFDAAGMSGIWVGGLRLTDGVVTDELLTTDAEGDVVSSGETQGAQGATGAQGSQGHQGHQGDVGSQGAQGADGQDGQDGQDGATGAQGAAGADSTVPGPQGHQGDTGATGAQGAAGADSTVPGPQGFQGDVGAQGAQGAQGEPG